MLAVPYGDDFPLSSYGIREPVGQAFLGEMDYIVTPLLAVDLSGNRLGYGGGYYDRYFKKHPKALRVGYCFDFQIVNEVYAEPWDEKIDYIVTDKQIIRANER
jgi:5-formyltetrahydrofolate cyclo-ligase